MRTDVLRYRRVAAVCAQPDDETFGLGAIISSLVDAGARVDVVCLTRGEASALGATADLATSRASELRTAAGVLGVRRVTIADHPDGGLTTTGIDILAAQIRSAAEDADALLTFDHGGITGHPDHQRTTAAAVEAARQLRVPLLGWAIPASLADALTLAFGVRFVGRHPDELDHRLVVDRTRQMAAIACHGSQLTDNPVPHRRIELQGDVEHVRDLHRPGTAPPDTTHSRTTPPTTARMGD